MKLKHYWLQQCANKCEGVFYAWNKPREIAPIHVIEYDAVKAIINDLLEGHEGIHGNKFWSSPLGQRVIKFLDASEDF